MINKTITIMSISLVVLLSACNGDYIKGNHNELTVHSEPSGALVYVMGDQQGVTPMTLNVTTLYPATYSKENEQHYGRITLRREGCSDKVIKVTNDMTGKLLKEKLSCVGDEENSVKETIINNNRSANETALSGKSTKQRLKELQSLKDDSLIDDEEYQKIRRRILQSL